MTYLQKNAFLLTGAIVSALLIVVATIVTP